MKKSSLSTMKNNRTKFAGVAMAALLASIGLSPSANAQLILQYQDTFAGHHVAGQIYTGAFEIKLSNFDMGTVYNQMAEGASISGEAALNNPAVVAAPATGAVNGEDSWGIARITEILDGDGFTVWTPAAAGAELTIMFYGAEDFYLEQVESGFQEIGSTGLHVDLYLQSFGVGFTPYPGSVLGSTGRIDEDTYTNVTDGTLILSTISTAGFIYGPGTFGGLETEFRAHFNAGSGGEGETYLNVTGGSMAANFDTDSITSIFTGATADLFAQFTTEIFESNPGNPLDDWLVSSNDPVRGVFVAVPEPSTYGLIAAGALLGMVAIRRMKKRAQAL